MVQAAVRHQAADDFAGGAPLVGRAGAGNLAARAPSRHRHRCLTNAQGGPAAALEALASTRRGRPL